MVGLPEVAFARCAKGYCGFPVVDRSGGRAVARNGSALGTRDRIPGGVYGHDRIPSVDHNLLVSDLHMAVGNCKAKRQEILAKYNAGT